MAPSPELELPCFADVWTPLVHGDLLYLRELMDASDAPGSNGDDGQQVAVGGGCLGAAWY
jgi:hypothetical protein